MASSSPSIVHKAFGSHSAGSDADRAARIASAPPVGLAARLSPRLSPSRFHFAPEYCTLDNSPALSTPWSLFREGRWLRDGSVKKLSACGGCVRRSAHCSRNTRHQHADARKYPPPSRRAPLPTTLPIKDPPAASACAMDCSPGANPLSAAKAPPSRQQAEYGPRFRRPEQLAATPPQPPLHTIGFTFV